METYDTPCAFHIIKQKNLKVDDEMEDEFGKVDHYMSNKGYPTYVFSEESYKMVLDEILIFISHDWGQPTDTKYIKYYKDDEVIEGGTREHFYESVKGYKEPHKQEYIDAYESEHGLKKCNIPQYNFPKNLTDS